MDARFGISLFLLTAACGGQSAAAPTNETPATVSSTGGADRHSIVLHRAHAVGDRARETLRGESTTIQRITVGGQEVQNEVETLDIEMVADVLIREVEARGKATRTEYTVERCTTGGETPRDVVPPGSVIVVTAVPPPGDGTIALVGGELSEEQTKLIDLVVSTTVSPVDEDQMFGSEEMRAVGESWPIDSALAARDLSKIENMTFTADEIEGGTTFTSLEAVDDVLCQRLNATMRARDFEFAGLPDGATTQSTSLEVRMGAALPVDGSARRLRLEEAMHMQMTIHVPTDDGGTAVMTVDSRRSMTREVRPQ